MGPIIFTTTLFKDDVVVSLVGGVMTFPVLVGDNESLIRSEAVVLYMEAQGHQDVTAVVWRNLLIAQGLQVVDVLLLMFCVQEVLTLSDGKQKGQQKRYQHKTWWKRQIVSGT